MLKIKKALLALAATALTVAGLSLGAAPAVQAAALHGPAIPCVLKTGVCPPFE
jgi:hypothetical protein